jgi:hypothetical protein
MPGDISKRLKNLRKRGRLIPFVGAGLSKPLGLPDFSELIAFMAKQLGYDPEVFKLNGTESQLAEFYVAKKRIGPLRREWDRRFNPSENKIRKSRAHTALVDMELPLIYTTNYDRIIERAFRLKKKRCYSVRNLDDIVNAPTAASTQIVKLHGTFERDAGLVLTETSYFDRLEFESPIDIKLRADILGKTLLFLGYSLSDLNVRYMLYKLHKMKLMMRRKTLEREEASPTGFLTAFRSNEIQRELLAKWNIEIVELDPVEPTESLAEFLESLV